MRQIKPLEFPQFIDHTLLKTQGLSFTELKSKHKLLALEAKLSASAAVCVRPEWVSFMKDIRQEIGAKFRIASVIGFPIGEKFTTWEKIQATKKAIQDGAEEIDMVVNYQLFKQRLPHLVYQDLQRLSEVCQDTVLKIISENALLAPQDKIPLWELILEATKNSKPHLRFLKTSTGFASPSTPYTLDKMIEDLNTMHRLARGQAGIKAAGGISTTAHFQKLILGCPWINFASTQNFRVGSGALIPTMLKESLCG